MSPQTEQSSVVRSDCCHFVTSTCAPEPRRGALQTKHTQKEDREERRELGYFLLFIDLFFVVWARSKGGLGSGPELLPGLHEQAQ